MSPHSGVVVVNFVERPRRRVWGRPLARDAACRAPPVRRCCGACSQIKLTVEMSQLHRYNCSRQVYYAARLLIAQQWVHTWLMCGGLGQVECQCKKFRDACYLASHLLHPAGPRLPRATNCRPGAVLHRLLTRGTARAAASCESRRFRARNGHCPWRIFPPNAKSRAPRIPIGLLVRHPYPLVFNLPLHPPASALRYRSYYRRQIHTSVRRWLPCE
jgi:hypothetical protein